MNACSFRMHTLFSLKCREMSMIIFLPCNYSVQKSHESSLGYMFLIPEYYFVIRDSYLNITALMYQNGKNCIPMCTILENIVVEYFSKYYYFKIICSTEFTFQLDNVLISSFTFLVKLIHIY